MKIGFVLLDVPRNPIGGYKMVYEYCNRLQKKGFQVTIFYTNSKIFEKYKLSEPFRRKLADVATQIFPTWFKLDKNIKKMSLPDYQEYQFDLDVVIATALETVEYVRMFPEHIKKCYFIQDFENWHASNLDVYKTYELGWNNIVISGWLKEIVDTRAKSPSILIKNPIDTNLYFDKNKKRIPHSIGLLYHQGEHKGLKYAFRALNKIRMLYPDLTVEMFGVYDPPKNLPKWIHYTKKATQKKTIQIYNSVKVFLCATVEEGYGLTGLESMACGACLVSTSYKGVREYAKDEYNALLSPIKDSDSLVKNVQRVFEDDKLYHKLVLNGKESSRLFSWDKATDLFIDALS